MDSSNIIRIKGEQSGIEVSLSEMEPGAMFERIMSWVDQVEILQTLEGRYDKEREAGDIDTLEERLETLAGAVNRKRIALINASYEIILENLAGPIVDGDKSYEPKTLSDLQRIFPFSSAPKLTDLNQIVSDYIGKYTPDEEVLKN